MYAYFVFSRLMDWIQLLVTKIKLKLDSQVNLLSTNYPSDIIYSLLFFCFSPSALLHQLFVLFSIIEYNTSTIPPTLLTLQTQNELFWLQPFILVLAVVTLTSSPDGHMLANHQQLT